MVCGCLVQVLQHIDDGPSAYSALTLLNQSAAGLVYGQTPHRPFVVHWGAARLRVLKRRQRRDGMAVVSL